MYESVTYEDILQRMLDRVPDTMDKREGSIIYDALAPAAVELQLIYIEFDTILHETFGDTASRDYLIRRGKERGLEPDQATNAILKGVFTPSLLNIPLGSRFNLGDLNYVVTAKISDGIYQLTCEMVGAEGNKYLGDLVPVEYIDGLQTAQLTEILIPGEEEEDTEVFRARYFESFNTQSFGGNKADYLKRTNALPGVGSTKITPVWNGGGTVKLTILNSNYSKASTTLINAVQEALDPTQDGGGLGIAPIGHRVTVDTVVEIAVNIVTSIIYDSGYSYTGLQSQIIQKISDYLLELRTDWSNQNELVVRVAQVEARLLTIIGILDITGTKINGTANNLALTGYQVPVLGGVIA